MRRESIADDALVGFGDARQELVDARLERGDLGAVFGDVREVRLAARADLVDLLDFGLDRVDELFAAGDRLDVPVEPVGELLDFGQPRLDGRQLLLAERHLRAAPFELLEHRLGAGELILGRLDLADGVALPALDAIELREQLVLDRRRSAPAPRTASASGACARRLRPRPPCSPPPARHTASAAR